MHDNIGHALVVMNVKLEAAQLLYARDPARGDAELEATRGLIRATMADLRRALADLRAPAVETTELSTMFQRLAGELRSRAGIATTCAVAPGASTLAPAAREALWHVAREALANVERHAAASHAEIALDHDNDSWTLRVADDGLGLSDADLHRPDHYGVVGMRERMQAIGGTLSVSRAPGGGTIVEARLPCAGEPPH
jgi:signal transduction histidine kinase